MAGAPLLPCGTHLRVNEIYPSIQGESTFAGYPCTFIRLTGCRLRCRYCDTAHAYSEGEEITLSAVLDRVRSFGIPLVELTGGEPLEQPLSILLMELLLAERYRVLLETDGAEPVEQVPLGVHIILDVKTPGSGMARFNREENFSHLKPSDEIKFVICDLEDFRWSVEYLTRYPTLLPERVIFSPAFGQVAPADLARWIMAKRLRVRMQLQLHKYIWDPQARGV